MSYIIGIGGADLTTIDTSATYKLGQIGQAFDGKIYKYVTYSEEAAAVDGVAGEACYYVAATGYANNDVTSDLTASDELGAGVLQAVMSDNEFGWIQIKGFATLTIALSTATDGSPYTPTGSGDGTLEITALVTDAVCAFGGDTSANEILCDFPY